MVRVDIMHNTDARMANACSDRWCCTNLLDCLVLDVSAYMLIAVASTDRKSHADVAKIGRSVYSTILSMGTMCFKACFSNNCSLYAVCRRACALVLGGRSISIDLMWAGALKWSHLLCLAISILT